MALRSKITMPHYLIILAFISTTLNVIAGLLGIYFATQGNLYVAFQLVILGAIFDYLDGRFAKRAPYQPSIGIYADSFGDVITFAILPSYMLINVNLMFDGVELLNVGFFGQINLAHILIPSYYAICGWFRLVRFAARPTGILFEGLPSPAAALLVGSWTVVASEVSFNHLFSNGILVSIVSIAAATLMVTTIKYPSPKRMFKIDLILIGVAGITVSLFVIFPSVYTAIPIVFISTLYTVMGPWYLKYTQKKLEKLNNSQMTVK